MIRFCALGAPELRGEDAPELRAVLTQPRLLALLVYLVAARPRGFHRRDSLVAMFWPEVGHDQARNALRQVLHRLRRALGDDVVVSRGAEELSISDTKLWSDIVAFDQAVEAGQLQDALTLYRGELLPGFFLGDAPEFERWLDGERDRLRTRAAAAARQLSETEASAGRSGVAAHWAGVAAAMTPDDEPAIRRLITLLASSGNHAGALRAYESFARRMSDEMGLAPSQETQSLVARLRASGGETASPTVAVAERARSAVAPVDVGAYAPPAHSVEVAPPEARVSHAPRSRWIARGALGGVLVAAAAATMLIRGEPPTAASPKVLAVFPFSVRSTDELQYLADGMVDLLSAKMEGASGFRAIDPRSVIAATGRDTTARDIRSASAIARRLGARWMISGEVVEIAGRLQLSGTMYDVTNAPRAVTSASVSGETTMLFQLVDDLTGRMLASVVAGRDTSLTRLAAVTTHSLPALKAFLQGEQALRAGRDASAAAAFRDAATLDTTFALAQYRLALAATWSQVPGAENPAAWAALAARHSSRLPSLFRDLLHAYDAYKAGRADEAERIYRSVTESHPDNVEAWLMLGEVWFHYNFQRGRSPAEGRNAFDRALSLDPANAHAMIHLARLDAMEGRMHALDSLAGRYAATHSDAERITEIRVLQAYMRDDPAERAAAARAAMQAGDLQVVSLLQAGLLYAQNPLAAREIAPAFTSQVRDPTIVRVGRMTLSDLPLARGIRDRGIVDEALGSGVDQVWYRESEILLASEPIFNYPRTRIEQLRREIAALERYPLRTAPSFPTPSANTSLAEDVRKYFLALLSIRLGDQLTAVHLADELAGQTDTLTSVLSSALSHGIRAELARSRGDLKGAIAEIDRFTLDIWPTFWVAHWGVRERFLRAELLHAMGREREALGWFDSIAASYDLPFIAAAHFRRGEIAERLGDAERARFHYGRCIRLWDNADAALQPMVTQARAALDRLGQTSGHTGTGARGLHPATP